MELISKNKKGSSSKNWIQKAVNPAHKGYCTPVTKATCTPRRKALAMTFKKMAKSRKHQEGGVLLPNIQEQLDALKRRQQVELTPLATPQVTSVSLETKAPDRIASKKTSISFGDAFKSAKGQGLDTFKWRGKVYTTKVKGGSSKETEKPQARTPKSSVQETVRPKTEFIPSRTGPIKETAEVVVTAKKPAKNRIESAGSRTAPITELPEVVKIAPKNRVTTIEQARVILKDKNAMPSDSKKTYNLAEHQGFIEKNADTFNLVGDILGGLLVGTKFNRPSASIMGK